MSDDLFNRVASTDKHFHVVDGANHMSLYDLPQYVDEAVAVLSAFLNKNCKPDTALQVLMPTGA